MKAFLTCIMTLALALAALPAHAAGVGVGAFGGVSVPIVQDDSNQGSIFGARVPIQLIPLISAEPFFASSKLGDKDQTIAGLPYTRDGGEITAFGVNVLLGGMGAPGVRFYPYAGLGSYELKRNGAEKATEVGYNFGLGLGLSPIPQLAIDLRGELNMIATGDTSRKYANVTVGAAYTLFRLP